MIRWLTLFRPTDYLLTAYLSYVLLLALLRPLSSKALLFIVSIDLAVVFGLVVAAWGYHLRRSKVLHVLRDLLTLACVILAYRQMGWLAPASHTNVLENQWIKLDRYLLSNLGLRELIEAAGPLFPAILEISYSIVYTLGLAGVMVLYNRRRFAETPRFLTIYVAGTILAYALFPFFPSEPPWTVFPGQDMPTVTTLFRTFNLKLVGGYGIHTSVFPSAHVSSAFAAAYGLYLCLPERRIFAHIFFVVATLIAIATVYGRYHYAVDAVAGFALSTGIFLILKWAGRARKPQTRASFGPDALEV